MIKVAFFKAKHGDWQDKLINLVTGRKGYSHVEIVYDQHRTIGIHQAWGFAKIASRPNIVYNPHWTILEAPIEEVEDVMAWALTKTQAKTKYDYLGAILAPTRTNITWKDRLFCSNFVAKALKAGGCMLPSNPTPNRLYTILKERNNE